MLLIEFVATYADQRDIREGTVGQYLWSVRSLEKFLGRPSSVADLQPEIVNRWLRHLGENASPYTVRSKRCQMLVLWRAAADEGLVAPPPRRIRAPRLPERLVRTLDAAGVHTLLDFVRTLPGRLNSRPRAGYLATLIAATCDTALRQSDLHRLTWDQVQQAHGRLQIVQVKTGRRRWVVFSDATMVALSEFCGGDRGPIWPRGDRTAVTREIRQAAVACGLGKVTHTDLRRSAIRSVEEQQAGAGWIFAGHESDSTTRRWYLPKDLQYDSLPKPRLG